MKRIFIFIWIIGSLFTSATGIALDDTAPVSDARPAEGGFEDTSDRMAPSEVSSQGESITHAAPPPVDFSSKPMDQRVARLERVTANLSSMNLPQQISDLQQQVAELRGQLQVQAHQLELLNKQVRSFYEDLDHRIKQDAPSASPSASQVEIKRPNPGEDAKTYQAAFVLFVSKQYEKARLALQNYLQDFPQGKYLGGAHYWLGEIYWSQKNTAKAEAEFNRVVRDYPTSDKVADAKLKLAIIHISQGKKAQAKEELLAIKKQYPNTTAAQMATLQLQQLTIDAK